MFEIHNGELTQDVILGAVSAWLEQKNDTVMTIEVGFQRDTSRRTNYDLWVEVEIHPKSNREVQNRRNQSDNSETWRFPSAEQVA